MSCQAVFHARPRGHSELRQLGISFDWARTISTCDPSYYRHTQALFTKMFASGFAYQASSTVNWDPVDKTVLANEQVHSVSFAVHR